MGTKLMYGFEAGVGYTLERAPACTACMQDDGEILAPLPGVDGDVHVRVDGASDQELLREYAEFGVQAAFSRLVERHVALVYSAALRQTGHHEMAQDATQAVFVILARKAATLRRETVLSGWLFRAVRYAALDARKLEARRQLREQEAAHMQQMDSVTEAGREWEQLAPLLDEGMSSLGEKDRHAILLRFFERKSFGEIGSVLGGNENSARVRVVRAVEKLRGYLRRRGVIVSAVALSGALLSNAVQAAPSAVAASVGGCAAWAAIGEGLARRLFWRRAFRMAVVVVIFLLLLGGAGWRVRQQRAAEASGMAEAARGVRELMIGIDRTFITNDRNGFVALVHLGNPPGEQFGSALSDYVRAQGEFRQEMQRAFNVRQRAFDATFSQLCGWAPPEKGTYLMPASAATNIMSARYPVHFVKVDGGWKWDIFEGLSTEARAQRVAVLREKTALLDRLTAQVREKSNTNVLEILASIRGTAVPAH